MTVMLSRIFQDDYNECNFSPSDIEYYPMELTFTDFLWPILYLIL